MAILLITSDLPEMVVLVIRLVHGEPAA